MAVVAFLPALGGEFLFDDDNLIVRNPLVLSPTGIVDIWRGRGTSDYWPLTWSLFWLEWRLFAGASWGFHVVTVALHALNVVLFRRLLQNLKIPGATLAAILFAVHPVNVPSVAWIIETKNTLSLALLLTSAIAFHEFVTSSNARRYWQALFAFVLSLLAKTSGVMFPFLLGAWLWRRGHIERRDVVRVAPFFLASLVMGLVTLHFQQTHSAGMRTSVGGFWERIATLGFVPSFYLAKLFFPYDLNLLYPRFSLTWANGWVWASWTFLFSLVIVGYLFRKKWGATLLWALAVFGMLLLPVSGLFDMAFFDFSQVSHHLQYLPSLAIFAGVGAFAAHLGEKLSAPARKYSAAFVAVALVAISGHFALAFRNAEGLYRFIVERNPKAWIAQSNLAKFEFGEGNYPLAVERLERALAENPRHFPSRLLLATMAFAAQQNDFGERHLEAAKAAAGSDAEYLLGLAELLRVLRREAEAMEYLRRAEELSR